MLSSSVWRGRSHWSFSAGLLLGGLTTAFLLLLVGSLVLRPLLPDLVAPVLLMIAIVLVTLHELDLIHLKLPQNSRQVPPSVVQEGGLFGALQFGFEMGTGLRTFMTSALPHALALACLMLVDPLVAAVIGLGFGSGRAAMTLTRHAHRDHTGWDSLLNTHEVLLRRTLALAAVPTVFLLIVNEM